MLLGFPGRKPHVKPTSNRLLSLSVARKRKGEHPRTHKSSSDCPPSGNDRIQSGVATSALPSSMQGNLLRAKSVSLDSVFVSSTSRRMHMLPG